MMRSAGFLLLAFAALALAQTKEPQRAPLNLKLDNPAAWATSAPDAKKDEKGSLPSLGGNARPVPQTPAPRPRQSPYPPASNPGR